MWYAASRSGNSGSFNFFQRAKVRMCNEQLSVHGIQRRIHGSVAQFAEGFFHPGPGPIVLVVVLFLPGPGRVNELSET